MTASRREFLSQLTAGSALFGALPMVDAASWPEFVRASTSAQQQAWDLTWTKRVTGKHRAVFDVPEIDSGYGVWRSTIWMQQYKDVMGAQDKDLSTVLIMRHNGIALAMKQSFWDEYGLGKAKSAMHPLTAAPTDRNPALLGESDGVPAPFSNFALDKFIANGGIALGCNLAFGDCVDLVKKKHNVDDAAARTRALEALVPGVILQPSGVFAAVRAQQTGAVYVRAS